ncbi:hypothetical protein GGI07_001350 [Coemansia sp. Benny D115]|nr:hypothetical protein GGI07_001350 [Coemansia sp. Benny D115]
MADKITVLVTGASGMLGRQVLTEAEQRANTRVIGTALTRATGKLKKLDLSDEAAVAEFLEREKPQAIIHCAAERRPEAAERNQAAVEQLNSAVPGTLARHAHRLGAFFVYISTDYVFDGTSPPYGVNDRPNPLNFYGRTKLAGEKAVMEANPLAAILRVPLLYGAVEYLGEGAVDVLLAAVKDRSKQTKMDAIQARFPTCVDDVARVLLDMTEISVGATGEAVSGVFHFSSTEQMTKYEMSLVFADILGIQDTSYLVKVTEKPKVADVARPDNTQLSNEAMEEIGINTACVPFKKWWSGYLATHKEFGSV